MPKRKASARWEGSIVEGGGRVSLGSGAYEGPYSFQSRFKEGDGTNPEELLGAAHAGCFTMALALVLGNAGHEPASLETDTVVHLEKDGEGSTITRIELRTRGRVPGITADEFREHAQIAKDNCPISKAVTAVETIELDADLAD